MTDDAEIVQLQREVLSLHLFAIRTSDPSNPENADRETTDYDQRNAEVYHALAVAGSCGFRHGIRTDPMEPGWMVAYIDLPQGQVSWHLPGYKGTYDRHTTAEKYNRIEAYDDTLGHRG